MSRYGLVLLFSGIIPLLFSFWPQLKFWRNFKALFLSIGLVTIIFGCWDIWAASRGHWHFAPEAVSSFKVVNLPLEEFLFFIVITFCCIFTWEVILYFKPKSK